MTGSWDVVVVGGGLAGLAAAAFAGRAGGKVLLLEKGAALGGRARSDEREDAVLNLGPHALYRRGRGAAVLRELGVAWTGRSPATRGAAIHGGRLYRLPAEPLSLLATGLLNPAAKLETARLLSRLPRLRARELDAVPLSAWLEGELRTAGARELLAALVRLTSYAHAPEVMSAGAALEQMQIGLAGGVTYLDGGWQSLVRGLEAAARIAGVECRARQSVEGLSRDVDSLVLQHAAGRERASTVILALPPPAAAALLDSVAPAAAAHARQALPAQVACLQLVLRRLPRPDRLFALGIDRPTYFSVHSAAARLSPAGHAVVEVARYLGNDDARGAEQELEAVADLVQPGWRGEVVRRRVLAPMAASGTIPLAREGGSRGRPCVEAAPGVFLAGDWVGPEGLLADAALASAAAAARAARGTAAGARRPAAVPA